MVAGPITAAGASVNTSSGARSSHAHATPFTTDAMPGPSRQTRARASGDFRLRDCRNRTARFCGRQHERQAGTTAGVDEIEVAAAARDAEHQSHAGPLQPRDDEVGDRDHDTHHMPTPQSARNTQR